MPAKFTGPTPDYFLNLQIRAARPRDWNFIADSWKKSLLGKDSTKEAWSALSARIDKLQERGANFLVACNPTDEDQIFGWTCWEYNVVHYVYTKQPYRRQRVAFRLLRENPHEEILVFSTWTRNAEEIDERYPGALRRVDF